MDFEITKGTVQKPYKVVVYGPEGIGLSIQKDLLDHWISRDFLNRHPMKCLNRKLITSLRRIHLSAEH